MPCNRVMEKVMIFLLTRVKINEPLLYQVDASNGCRPTKQQLVINCYFLVVIDFLKMSHNKHYKEKRESWKSKLAYIVF